MPKLTLIICGIERRIIFRNLTSNNYFIYFFKFNFREGKGGRNRGKKTSVCSCLSLAPYRGQGPTTQACALDWESNQLPFGLQASTQSTEPHQPGWYTKLLRWQYPTVWMQYYPYQNPIWPSGRNWWADLKIHRTQNNQNNLER